MPALTSITQEQSHPLITDPFLLSILATASAARTTLLSLPTTTTTSPSLAQKPLYSQVSHLRGQNRRLAHLVRTTKSTTASSRLEIDTLHLSLQNLYYESRHLAGEIAACERFPHSFLELPLCSEEEFLARFPEWRDEGEGEVMEARIEAEGRERGELEERRKGLVARKMELVRENAKRKEELGKLDRELEAFIEAAKPIQKTFEKEW